MIKKDLILLTTFLFTKSGNDAEISCTGCSELIPPYEDLPFHIRGIIKFQGKIIPVIDFSAQFHNKPVQIDGNSCLFLIQHKSLESNKTLRSAVILEDFDEIMKLCQYVSSSFNLKKFKKNSSFLSELAFDLNADRLLEKNHKSLFNSSFQDSHINGSAEIFPAI